MPAGRSKHAAAVEAIDIQARALYQRTCEPDTKCDDVALAVRNLHAALGDLLLEAEDPNSLLNAPSTLENPNVFASQLTCILEDCEYTLWQVSNAIEKQHGLLRKNASAREEDVISLARFKVANQTMNVAFFLDTVREPTFADMAGPPEEFEDIHPFKAQVRIIAERLFSQPDFVSAHQAGTISSEELRRIFNRELIRDNFSHDLLSRFATQELINSYIQELDFDSYLHGTHKPQPKATGNIRPAVPPRIPLKEPVAEETSPKEIMPDGLTNEKFDLSVKLNRPTAAPAGDQGLPYRPSPGPQPVQQPSPQPATQRQPSPQQPTPVRPPFQVSHALASQQTHTPPTAPATQMSQQQQLVRSPNGQATHLNMNLPAAPFSLPSSSSGSSTPEISTPSGSDNESEDGYNDDLALISTRDLLDYDIREQEYAGRDGVTYLYPQLMPTPTRGALPAPPTGTSPSSYSLSPSTALTHPSSPTGGVQQEARPAPASSETPAGHSTSPRYLPSLPSPPPPYENGNGPSPIGAFGIIIPGRASPSANAGTSPVNRNTQLTVGLAPDSHGNEIPPDAVWTKINRKLVSPEVLERAGVRYEARPTFVALLGVVSRAQIAEYARQSAEAREARRAHYDSRRNQHRNEAPASRSANNGSSVRRTQSTPVDTANNGNGAGNPSPDMSCAKVSTFPPTAPTQSSQHHSGRRKFDRSRYVPAPNPYESDSDNVDAANKTGAFNGRVYPFIVSPPSSTADGINSPSDDNSKASRPRSILKNKNTNQLKYRDGRTIEVGPDGHSSDFENLKKYGRDRDREKRHRDREHRRDRDHRDRDRDRDRSRDKSDKDRSRKDRGRDRDDDYNRDSKTRDRSRRREERTHDSHKEADRLERRSERDRERARNRDYDRDKDRERDRDYDYSPREKDRKRRSYEREPEKSMALSSRSDRDRDHRYLQTQRPSHDYREHRNSWEGREGRDSRDGGRDARDAHDPQRREDRTRLRDAIGAAGIGGAAASLLSVLSEAAQGL